MKMSENRKRNLAKRECESDWLELVPKYRCVNGKM